MCKILIFGGTSEGRILAEFCSGEGIPALVSVVSDYGRMLLSELPGIQTAVRAMDAAQMEDYIKKGGFSLVIDATHPYAKNATENIRLACQRTGTRLLRCKRGPDSCMEEKGVLRFSSAKEAADFLARTSGNIFLAIGSRELEAFSGRKELAGRLFVRVLPAKEALSKCEAAGLSGKQVICMQGPFREELNIALIRHTSAAYLVTKDTGASGGFWEKQSAARKCQIPLVLIDRPREEGGLFLNEVKQALFSFARENGPFLPAGTMGGRQRSEEEPPVILAGIGPGSAACMTREVADVIRESDILLGAPRVLEAAREIEKPEGKERVEAPIYLPEEAVRFLKSHKGCGQAAILFSGDTGFYSGAKRLCERLRQEGIRFIIMPGLSSVSYFASKLNVPWEDAALFTAHGRELDIKAALSAGKREIFILMGGEDSVGQLCLKLCDLGLENMRLCVGENLSYPEERIVRGSATGLLGQRFAPLCIVFLESSEKLRADNER